MTLPDPAWLAALAALVTSLSSLVWSVRRKRQNQLANKRFTSISKPHGQNESMAEARRY